MTVSVHICIWFRMQYVNKGCFCCVSITHTPQFSRFLEIRYVPIIRSAYQKLVMSAKNIDIEYQLHYEINIGSHFSYFYPRPRGRRVQYLVCVCVCLCVCVCVCVLPQNCCKLQLSQNLNKLQVTNLVI